MHLQAAPSHGVEGLTQLDGYQIAELPLDLVQPNGAVGSFLQIAFMVSQPMSPSCWKPS